MSEIISVLVGGFLLTSLFALPIGGIIVFVQLRAKARREMLAGPWSTLARDFGGQLAGETVRAPRDGYQLTLEMRLVSVMDCMGSPYYSDGGTYTEARLVLDPRTEHRVKLGAPARFELGDIQRLLGASPLAAVAHTARVVLAEREARVVFHGPMGDLRALGAAFAGLDGLAEMVRKHGPVPLAR